MQNDPHEKLRSLMRRLAIATEQRRVAWEADSADTFSYTQKDSSVILSTRDHDGTAPYIIEIYDGSGRLVDRYQTSVDFVSVNETDASEELEKLYASVRRKALQIDDVLDALMRDLPPDPNRGFGSEPPF